jgi:signal transduction histidine kinase
LDGLLSELSEQMAGDSVKVETAWAKTQPVRASSTSLEFVFRSILLNAVHALAKRDARVIRVRTYAKDAFSCAEIADTGWGLNEEQIVKVFTPFFTTKGEWAEPGSPLSQVKGTGLSLAVSRSLINECGGHIELDSREGVGTTFRVCLPVETEKAVDNP